MATLRGWVVQGKGQEATFGDLDAALLEAPATAPPMLDIDVEYSSLNYKDALALEGKPGVLRAFPIIPGIDAVGRVRASDVAAAHGFDGGELVVVTGAGIGEEFSGGLATMALVPASAAVRVPGGFGALEAAAVGTAGFTAALSVLALERAGLAPEAGPVLVTGAGGGVGSLAVALLAARGFEVHALTGRAESLGPWLSDLGASAIIDRADLADAGRPLQRSRWAGAVDTVGGPILANVFASLEHSGIATACGLAQSADLPASVLPFILRGVSLLGIDSVRVDRDRREAAWQLIASALSPAIAPDILASLTREIPLAQAREVSAPLLEGQVRGRTVVRVG